MIEVELRRRFVHAVSMRCPNVRLFIRNVGVFSVADRTVRAGIKGQADIWGFVKTNHLGTSALDHWDIPLTLPLEIEIKRKGRKLSAEQEHWRDFCREWGVGWLQLDDRGEADPIGRWLSEFISFINDL